jgi:hypothetical protein
MKRPLILALIGLCVILVLSFFILRPDTDSSSDAQAAAIRQAKAYKVPTGTVCAEVVTPAIHQASGAQYTFPNGCLAPGWEAAR